MIISVDIGFKNGYWGSEGLVNFFFLGTTCQLYRIE